MKERGFVFQPENLSSPQEAVATYLAAVSLAAVGVERIPLVAANGRILCEDIAADADYPNAPRSAMDGFAVRSADGATRLRIVGEIAMGSTFARAISLGEAVRIPTGGVVPDGADAVVPIEDARVDGDHVAVLAAAKSGENINLRASDMRVGAIALERGTRIAAAQLGVLATLGVVDVPVFRKPRVAVISSGDELVPAASQPKPGQIRDSNRYAVGAALEALGCDVVHHPTVPDDRGALESALRGVIETSDAVVLTGGSSVGERDHTPAAIVALGAPGVLVHGLRVKPGKPTVFAAIGAKPVIGLPGNPTSALLILQAVAAPILAMLAGYRYEPLTLSATLAAPVRGRLGWTWYVPTLLKQEGGRTVAHPLPLRSSTVSVVAKAGGFITVPEEVEELPAGSAILVTRFF